MAHKASRTCHRVGTVALAAITAGCLLLPSPAFASVSVDETELAEGANEVGGGTATLNESLLDMFNVTAYTLATDQDLTMNFNGGNDLEDVTVKGDANVQMNFAGENEVEDVFAQDNSNVTINANGHNEFEEVTARDRANVSINVTGENDFEQIKGVDDANITVRGTDCQKNDVLNLGEDEEDTWISSGRGDVTIDHVTVNVEGEKATIGSAQGNTRIDTSCVAQGDDNEYTRIEAGDTMEVRESVIDIEGTMASQGQMTINHSDVSVEAPDEEYDEDPYRVWSATGIDLINEENGEVKQGDIDGQTVWYVDTGDGEDVELYADGDPAYYGCANDAVDGTTSGGPIGDTRQPLPKTADPTTPLALWSSLAGAILVAFPLWRKHQAE